MGRILLDSISNRAIEFDIVRILNGAGAGGRCAYVLLVMLNRHSH